MTDQDKLDSIKSKMDLIRKLIPAGSHILLQWGEEVKDIKIKPKTASGSDPCPICHGRIYYV